LKNTSKFVIFRQFLGEIFRKTRNEVVTPNTLSNNADWMTRGPKKRKKNCAVARALPGGGND